MKALGISIVLMVAILATTFEEIAAQSSTDVKRYKVKSGIIEYKITGMQNGTETLYFDDWGLIEAKYTNTEISMMGIKQKQNQLTILDGGITYNIDVEKKTGTKMQTPLLDDLSKSAKQQGKDMSDVGMQMLKQMGGEKIGEGEVAGYNAEIYEIKQMRTKAWVYNGVTLKSEANMMGMEMISTAVKAQFNVDIPKDKITLPADVTITEMANPLKSWKK